MTDQYKDAVPFSTDLIASDFGGYQPADLDYHKRQGYEQVRRRYDRSLQACGEKPFYPQEGQSVDDYRRTLLANLAPHTQNHKRLNAHTITADNLQRYETRITAEALDEPRRMGKLVPVTSKDQAGRVVIEHVGDIRAWMDPLKSPTQMQVGGFRVDGDEFHAVGI